jgi:hypothetical protein
MKLVEQLSRPDSPYDFSLDLEQGRVLEGDSEYPDLEIEDVKTSAVKEVKVQVFRLKETCGERAVIMRRLVAVLEGDQEIDVGERFAIDASFVDNQADTSKCNACFKEIKRPQDLVMHEGKAYHDYCMED